jgi:hypothetical protein
LKTGAWLITYQPSAPNSQRYRGGLRVTSNNGETFISGDLYNGTTEANPADGIPILPRKNYEFFVRTTGYTQGANRAFSLNMEFYRFLRFVERRTLNDTVWEDEARDGGYIVDLSPATAPSGYPDAQNYFEGQVKIASSGAVVGKFTMGWVNSFIRKITVEIGTVKGLKIPESDDSGTRTWKTIFSEVGWDITVNVGNTSIPEPNPNGFFDNNQQHRAMLDSRTPTDFDKEWKYYLLVVRHMVGVERGAMIDPTSEHNGLPREGTVLTTDWVWGTLWDGTPDTRYPWPESIKGKKFVELNDPWYRTAVHEVGHFFNLQHPTEFENDIMTDTQSYVEAGANGVTPLPFPDNVTPEVFHFIPYQVFLMQHRPDIHIRPAYVDFGSPAQVCVFLISNRTS